MESQLRTVIKTVSWRVIALIITILILYMVGDTWWIALSAGIVANIAKTILYYLHERVWNTVKWGRKILKSAKKWSETYWRSLVKTVSWKLVGTMATILPVYFYTLDWKLAIGSGILINVIKAFLYYFHERIWNKISWEKNH